MAGFLVGAGPRLSLSVFDFFDNIIRQPYDPNLARFEASSLVDKRMCVALLKNKAIMDPFMRFCIDNAAENPSSDMEYVAMGRGAPIAANLFGGGRKKMGLKLETSWSYPRYGF